MPRPDVHEVRAAKQRHEGAPGVETFGICLVEHLARHGIVVLGAEAASIPGPAEQVIATRRFARFRLIILPLSRPGLISGAVLCFSIAISVVVTSALLGGRTGRMFGNDIYEQVITAANWPFASALSIMLILAILISMSLAIGAFRRNAAGGAR
ncbi:ABC transporter permease subunit [Bradyrhizobium sp.]|uniref:ABC transporter permease subunit n=1 Tax=Bradyrhizobium sp. TaxID=376 RepID=UPI00345AD5B7